MCYRCNRNRDSKFYRCDPDGYLEWSCHKRIDRYMDPYFCPIAYREGLEWDCPVETSTKTRTAKKSPRT